ncbi:unnamed protein product [Alternaria alternata]
MSKIFGKGKKRMSEAEAVETGQGPSEIQNLISADGITVVTGEDDKSVDVVIVHGLNGSPDNTWTHSNGFYWPRELGKQLTSARIMVYGYNVRIEPAMGTNNTRVKSIADDLLNEIKQHRRRDLVKNRPLVLLGHSLGGLIIKRALCRASRDDQDPRYSIYNSTRLAIFFGTPNAGSRWMKSGGSCF